MADQPQRVRWHYPDSEVVSPDRVVEGSPDKYRELCDTVGDHPHGEPELLEEGGLEAVAPPDADEGPSESADGPYLCGAELSSGGTCSREVEDQGARCWQHGGG